MIINNIKTSSLLATSTHEHLRIIKGKFKYTNKSLADTLIKN